MDIDDERIREAVKRTEILRAPKQNIATFGMTNIYYMLCCVQWTPRLLD